MQIATTYGLRRLPALVVVLALVATVQFGVGCGSSTSGERDRPGLSAGLTA
jgi:hypothetical protein